MVILLSEGAAADAAARDRLAGVVNRLHIDTVLARGGHGQDFGRLGRRFRTEEEDPVTPDDRLLAPWVALAYDGSPAAAAESKRILDQVELATLRAAGRAVGARLPALLDRPGPARAGSAVAAAVAGPLRPGGLAHDLGLLAADAADRRAGGADRDLDLPQPAAADPSAADRRVGHPPPPSASRSPQSGSPQSGSPQSGSPQSGSPSGSESGSAARVRSPDPSRAPALAVGLRLGFAVAERQPVRRRTTDPRQPPATRRNSSPGSRL